MPKTLSIRWIVLLLEKGSYFDNLLTTIPGAWMIFHAHRPSAFKLWKIPAVKGIWPPKLSCWEAWVNDLGCHLGWDVSTAVSHQNWFTVYLCCVLDNYSHVFPQPPPTSCNIQRAFAYTSCRLKGCSHEPTWKRRGRITLFGETAADAIAALKNVISCKILFTISREVWYW